MLYTTIVYIAEGLAVTLLVTAIALPMGFILGLLFSMLRVYGGRRLAQALSVYSMLTRGVPPVVLLFLLYFIIAQSINLSAFWAGSLALGVVSGSYQMEIMRGAFLSVDKGQMIASRSIGMSQWTAIRYIVLPQAVRIAIPSWSNEAAMLLKNTSLVFVIGVPELLRRAQYVSARTYQPFIAYTVAAALYFVMTFGVNKILDALERKTNIPSI